MSKQVCLKKKKKKTSLRALPYYCMVLLFFCLVQNTSFTALIIITATLEFSGNASLLEDTPLLPLAGFCPQALKLHYSFSFIPPNSKHRVALPICSTSAHCSLKDSSLRHKLWLSEFEYMTNCYVLEIWHYIPCVRYFTFIFTFVQINPIA